MGEGPQLVRADLNHGKDGLIEANILEYFPNPLADLDRRMVFSWQSKNIPTKAMAIEIAKAFAWVESSATRLPTNEEVGLMSDKRDLQPIKARCYLWDFRNDSPMFLAVLPASMPLQDANPHPSGVWLAGDRICAFWRKPGKSNNITFCLGGKKRSLGKCVRHWEREIAGLSRALFIDVRVFIVAVLVVGIASVASLSTFGKSDFPTIVATAAALVAILAALYACLSKLLRMPRRFSSN